MQLVHEFFERERELARGGGRKEGKRNDKGRRVRGGRVQGIEGRRDRVKKERGQRRERDGEVEAMNEGVGRREGKNMEERRQG